MTYRAHSVSLDLDLALEVPRMVAVWKGPVRTGLRQQVLADLHDFLDIHRNIGAFASRLRKQVLDGHYRPAAPEFVHLEKRDGISRRLAVPEPADALLLQCLVEVIEPVLKKAQPSKNAFYSRSHVPGSVEQVDGTFAYPWWILWPQFQDRIWKFAESHPFIVVTDIANYFDSIPLTSLRNAISELGHVKENLLNFLFYLLESFSWRPYYIPSPGVGLPQIDFDAPRLLAHAYLFKIDRELERSTKGDFVRWMDDIDAGVQSRQAGKKLFRDLETVLNSQGLRLNSGKSKILSAKEAVAHFGIQENRGLTMIENSLKNGAPDGAASSLLRRILRRRARVFVRRNKSGQWEKVYKRYLKLLGMVKDACLESRVALLLEDVPPLRGAVFRYLQALGPNERRLAIVAAFLLSGHCEDEASLFEAVKCLIAWQTPLHGSLVEQIIQLAKTLAISGGVLSLGRICAAIWLLAKYGTASELYELVKSSKPLWEKSSWTARQVAAVVPLMPVEAREVIVSTAATNGMLQALQVLASVFSLSRMTTLDRQLRAYLEHPSPDGYPYPLQKVIVAKTLLEGGLLDQEKAWLRETLTKIVHDRMYRRMLGLPSEAHAGNRRANKALGRPNSHEQRRTNFDEQGAAGL